jgi:hypothetical protein
LPPWAGAISLFILAAARQDDPASAGLLAREGYARKHKLTGWCVDRRV